MSDVTCPYCGDGSSVCHDDGFGFEEDTRHEMECPCCEKNFVFYTFISFRYEAHRADCLNGKPHRKKPARIYPDIYINAWNCQDCEAKGREVDPKKHASWLAEMKTAKEETKPMTWKYGDPMPKGFKWLLVRDDDKWTVAVSPADWHRWQDLHSKHWSRYRIIGFRVPCTA